MYFVQKVTVNFVEKFGIYREYDWAENGEYDHLIDTRNTFEEANTLVKSLNKRNKR